MLARASLIVCIGCGGGPNASDPDAAVADASPDATPWCTAFGDCAWLDPYQRNIVGALAGEIDIAPGTRLAHRASSVEREATRVFLENEFAAIGLTPTRHGYPTGQNVLAQLDATTGTGGLIVVGAHFDGVEAGPGAADNATGVAIVLAVARYLSENVPERRHPIAFVLFDEEELGLIGSKAYARSLTMAGTDVAGAHVFDMLSFDGDSDKAVELWSPSPALAAAWELHGTANAIPVSAVTFDRSDHQAFLSAGFPATGIGEEFVGGDHTPHYHTATDTFANVSFAHLAVVTNLAFVVLEDAVTAP